ncbi:MAG TPA: aminopeptidase P family protein [Thauera sp.]|nr:aminopeptidase P family protein [Thauera sp.]
MTRTVRTPYADRIRRLREAMRRHDVVACIVPMSDPHLSEYLHARWHALRWLCGFHGSAGTLVVTHDVATLWVDSRYWEQAEGQLEGTGVKVMRLPVSRAPLWSDWLGEQLGAGARVAIDGDILALAAFTALRNAFDGHGLILRTDLDLLDEVWGDRPALPSGQIEMLPVGHQASSLEERLERLRACMCAQGVDWHLISSLDEIAWLLGLRGTDVEYNPVFLAHMLIGKQEAWLFVGQERLGETALAALATAGIGVHPYLEAGTAVGAIGPDQRMMLDPVRITVGLCQHLPQAVAVVNATNPCLLLKSVKDPVEIEGIRRAMLLDGAALCTFFAGLERALAEAEPITELTVDERITAARASQAGFMGPSFATIAGFNENGALVHYRATIESHAAIYGDGLLLVDSGGQYLYGTTDITRMVPIGAPSNEQKRDCTLVLKGMIALSDLSFPEGTRAPMLDAVARAPMWKEGIDYGHGTGHGVGCYLNVHEGPQSISFRADAGPASVMKAGMVTSIEPGIYRPGRWGVRIENLVLARPSVRAKGFLEFETLTLCPIDTRCLDLSALTETEANWLDTYHAQVRRLLIPCVDSSTAQWLDAMTEPVAGKLRGRERLSEVM